MSEYNLCSLLVHAHQGQMNRVQEMLQQRPGVEVHANTQDSRMIVTVEADNRREVAQQIMDIQQLEGVLSASMIYQFSDDIDEFEPAQKRMSA